MSSLAARNLLRSSTAAARITRSCSKAPLAAAAAHPQPQPRLHFASSTTGSRLHAARGFSSSMSKHTDMGRPGKAPDFDPEITDMANYIHNYKINSELAVCSARLSGVDSATRYICL